MADILSHQVRNFGPSSVESLSVAIYWPSMMDSGRNLLYLPTMPQVVRGQGTCTTDVINPNNLTVTAVSGQLVRVLS